MLLNTLARPADRELLEDAACAHYCGRYQDADVIFKTRLPAAHQQAPLALQYADMMTNQGREPERIQLLQQTLETLPTENQGLEPARLLLRFMLSDAHLWASGDMTSSVQMLPEVQRYLRFRGIENLNDIGV